MRRKLAGLAAVVAINIVVAAAAVSGWYVTSSLNEWPYARQVNGVAEDFVERGGEYNATISVIRTKRCDLTVFREIYDGSNTVKERLVVDVPGKNLLMTLDEYSVAYKVPLQSKPGVGKVCVSIAPRCNVIQRAFTNYLYRSCDPVTIK